VGTPAFAPRRWTRGAHRQTLIGYWARRALRWSLPSEDVWVDRGPGVRLLLRVTWQPGPRAARPLLVLVHGLGGSDRAAYVVSTGLLAHQRGFHVARMNMRGAGDGEGASAALYNAGLDEDVVAVLQALDPQAASLALAGFSLGGSLSLLALGRRRTHLPASLRAAAAVSAPLDLQACADALCGRSGRIYTSYFMRNLRGVYRRRQTSFPDRYERGRERTVRTIREFDERITAPYGGYRDAAEYYERSSPGPWLAHIDRPTLILAAADDPMVPGPSVERYPLPATGLVEREILETGGHMGFVAPSRAPGSFWAADRVVDYLTARVFTGS
jgi:predicted alpha/beta-fold hydrolase